MWSLLHLKPGALLVSRKEKINVLSLLLKLTEESLSALVCFLEQEYKSFDAQVGDTSCQIRAYKICLLANDYLFKDSIVNYIKKIDSYHAKLKQQLDSFKRKSSLSSLYQKELDEKKYLSDFLKENGLLLDVEDNIKFLILSHFLSKYCERDSEGHPQRINYDLIKQKLLIESTPSRLIANHYQAALSKLSCDFIVSLLSSYPHNDGNQHFLKALIRISDRNRKMLPYYNEMKILLHSCQSKSIPIIFSINIYYQRGVKKLTFLFTYREPSGEFTLQSTSHSINSSQAAVVFEGVVFLSEGKKINDYLKTLLSYSPLDLILYNAASHPQYASQIQNDFKLNPYTDLYAKVDKTHPSRPFINQMENELKIQQLKSSLLGCSKQNSKLFFVKHIYCSPIKNEMHSHSLEHAHFSTPHFNSILPKQKESRTA